MAVFHIDGNSMGNTIRNTMKDIRGYEDAITKMRKLSLNISGNFRQTVDEMKEYMEFLTPRIKDTKNTNCTEKLLLREMILLLYAMQNLLFRQ